MTHTCPGCGRDPLWHNDHMHPSKRPRPPANRIDLLMLGLGLFAVAALLAMLVWR